MTSLARVLIVDDALQPAEMIYILNGEVNTRPFHAARLFEAGLAPQIVIPREEMGPASEIGLYPNGTDVSNEVLVNLGVPQDRITIIEVEGGVTSTRDEAQVLLDYVKKHDIQNVIVVTSAFHTRRSRWIFRKILAGTNVHIQMSAAPQWKFDETNWWRNENGLLMLANEYLKFGYYLATY
ncbi:MAG: YdcF family protein [Anaerolineae bacterium]|nr:YdcF family protein [Anaerolineae bacterium]